MNTYQNKQVNKTVNIKLPSPLLSFIQHLSFVVRTEATISAQDCLLEIQIENDKQLNIYIQIAMQVITCSGVITVRRWGAFTLNSILTFCHYFCFTLRDWQFPIFFRLAIFCYFSFFLFCYFSFFRFNKFISYFVRLTFAISNFFEIV